MNKKKLLFYRLPIDIASSKKLTHSEKLIAAYLFTLFDNGRTFYATNAFLSTKLGVQKSVISPCLTKFESWGWITITNRQGANRRITLRNNPCENREFYRIYTCIASTNILTSLEKILLSYILSFTDNGKRFYAKNGMVQDVLDISKEGFNTSRKLFEELEWVKVLYPQSPRRELIILNHPTEMLASNFATKASENQEECIPESNGNLPVYNNILPINNDNNKRDKISNKRNEIRKDIMEKIKEGNVSYNTNFLSSLSMKTTTSTVEASPEAHLHAYNGQTISSEKEANASTLNEVEHNSTKKEANALVSLIEENISTEEISSTQAINNREEEQTYSFLGAIESNIGDINNICPTNHELVFNVRTYLDVITYIKLRNYLIELSVIDRNGKWTVEEADEFMPLLTRSQIDDLLRGIHRKN